MTEQPPSLDPQSHVTAIIQTLNRMMESLHMMTLGQLVPTIILRNPEADESTVVVSADKLPELADYLQRIRDVKMTPVNDEIERKH